MPPVSYSVDSSIQRSTKLAVKKAKNHRFPNISLDISVISELCPWVVKVRQYFAIVYSNRGIKSNVEFI